MKVSFLMPTRKRPQMLFNSIGSLMDTATGAFEILLALDNDDPTAPEVEAMVELNNWGDRVFIHRYERQTYRGFHNYINDLARKASGDWLHLWNDDCLMRKSGWHEAISAFDGKFVVLNPFVDTMAEYCRHNNQMLFPIIPKKWIQITGRWSNNCACDTWVQDISRELGTSVYLDGVVIGHIRHDVTGQNGDEIYFETRKDIEEFIRGDFYSQHQFLEREKDRNLILSNLQSISNN